MSFVDFNLSIEVESTSPKEYLIQAYLCRGSYVNELDQITGKLISVYKRVERFKEVNVLFIPNISSRESILHILYDVLKRSKREDEEVVQGCIYL